MVNTFMDFNKDFFLMEYIVKSEKELKKLIHTISYVPIDMNPAVLPNKSPTDHHTDLDDISTYAFFINPDTRIDLLDECCYTQPEADDITDRMILPYPVIKLVTGSMSDNYHETHHLKQMFYPAKEARILTPVTPIRQGINAIAVLWPEPNAKGKTERSLHYLEMKMTEKF